MSEDTEKKPEGLVGTVSELAKAIPVYQDLVQPTAQVLGKTAGRVVNAVVMPLKGILWAVESFESFIASKVAPKLKDVPEEDIKSPEPNVVGPLLDSLRYAGENEELREMYAKLLASAIDAKTSNSAHPAFVEMIRQMTQEEAKIMKEISDKDKISYISFGWKRGDLFKYMFRYYTGPIFGEDNEERARTGDNFVNLKRLGLIELLDDTLVVPVGGDGDLYKALRESSLAKDFKKIAENEGGQSVSITGAMIITELGEKFAMACIKEGTHERK